MNTDQTKRISKFLSLILRHEPEKVGLTLDEAGWVGVAELLDAMGRHGHSVTRDALPHVVETSDKKYDTTAVRYRGVGEKQAISEIRIGGTKTKLVFEEQSGL